MRGCLPAGVLLLSAGLCGAQEFLEDFETSTGSAQSYHKAPDDLQVKRLEDDAASGGQQASLSPAGRC